MVDEKGLLGWNRSDGPLRWSCDAGTRDRVDGLERISCFGI